MSAGTKQGRPPEAAQSFEDALRRHYAGESPKRPRNSFERAAMSAGRNGKRGGGRKVNPLSTTQQAAQLALYLVEMDGLTLSHAALRSALIYGVNRDNVRKYAARISKGPTVEIRAKVSPFDRQLVGGGVDVTQARPLLVGAGLMLEVERSFLSS